MYGKHFESMYEGSMYGAGVAVFAVWGYVISHARAGKVELNPKKLADTLGGTLEQIESAIEFLCSPDPMSRHKTHEGRRMLKEGQFQFSLPAWEDYQRIRNEDERREYNRVKQREYRAKNRNGKPRNVPCRAGEEGLADKNALVEKGQMATEPNERGN